MRRSSMPGEKAEKEDEEGEGDQARSERERRRKKSMVVLEDLPRLPRVEKRQVIASSYKYSGPLTGMKIRVRLLEYPSKEEAKKHRGTEAQMMKVVDDKVFTWQEKVHPPSKEDVEGEGKCLYSFVDTDAVTHYRRMIVNKRKEIIVPREEDQEWEDLEEVGPGMGTEVKQSNEKVEGKAEQTDKESERKRKEQEDKEKGSQRQKEEEEIKRRRKLVDFILEEEKSMQGLLGKQTRAKRPSLSVSGALLSHGGRKARSEFEEELEQRESSGKDTYALDRRTRAVERVQRVRLRKQELPSQAMIIVASIPHSSRKMVVCRITAFHTIGTITVKAPFGFRVVHATRQHVYRLSWELYLPRRARRIQTERPGKLYLGHSFEVIGLNEMRVFVMGEIVSARGFDSEPICVHYFLEIPRSQGWTDHNPSSTYGTTHSSFTTIDGIAHFSQHLSAELSFSLDALHSGECSAVESPLLLIMVLSIQDSGRLRYEGYGYTKLPSTPGPHTLCISTWKPSPRCIIDDMMQNTFLDVTPSLQDVAATHLKPAGDKSAKYVQQLGCKLGLKTEPSGEVTVRLHVIHHSPSTLKDEASKLELLEKMSSATILKSVQTVIDAFNRARQKTLVLQNPSNKKNFFRL